MHAACDYATCLVFGSRVWYAMQRFLRKIFERIMNFTLISHTDPHTIRGRPTPKEVERFRNGSIHEFYSLKASQISKVHTRSYEITNEPYMNSTYENTDKTMTADLKTNNDSKMNTSDVGKISNLHDKNLKDLANSNDKQIAILDKDESQQRSLNRKYQSLTCMFNILILLLTFILFNSCRVRFDIAYLITTIIVQAIANIGLHYVCSCMCLADDMITNILADCDILENVMNFTNVHEQNDVIVSLKVQEFRSRYAKYVYYNCTRVVCECHGYKRDRAPSRAPVNMLKRLSHKSRKLRRYVRSRLIKNIPKSSKVYSLIKNIGKPHKSRHKTAVRFVQKMRRKTVFRKRKVDLKTRYRSSSRADKHGKKYLKYRRLFSCNFPYSEYKTLTHKDNCTTHKLFNDIEKNPGPVTHYVEPNNTIKAPYSRFTPIMHFQKPSLAVN